MIHDWIETQGNFTLPLGISKVEGQINKYIGYFDWFGALQRKIT